MASYRYAAEPAGPVVDSSDIKRPKSAWGLFLDEYKKKCGSRGGIEKFNELQKAASVEWKSLSAEEKAPWIERERIYSDDYVQRRLEIGITAGPAPTPTKRKRSCEPKGYRRAFQFFVNEHRQQNPLYWSLFTFNQAQKELSTAWNTIPLSEKQKWFMLETKQSQAIPEVPIIDRPSPVATAISFSNSESSTSPHAGNYYSTAGMIPYGAPPQPLYEYYGPPPQQYSDYSGADGYQYQMPPYGNDPMGLAANNAMMGRRGEQDMYQYEQVMAPSAPINPVYSFSSRSFSDGDIQAPEKRRKFSTNEGNHARCDTSYSEGDLVSPQGTESLRGFHPQYGQSFSYMNNSSTGLDTNDFYANNNDEGRTFDVGNSIPFLDSEGMFPGSG